MNLNCLYYPRPIYLGKHGDTQLFPFMNCFEKPQNEAVLAAKSGRTLGQAQITLIPCFFRKVTLKPFLSSPLIDPNFE